MKELNIAAVLTKSRREKGLTQEDLAEYMGVSKASVSKWETGQSYPDITLLPKLAAYFNLSVDVLLGYEPQLTKEEIRRRYHSFSADFAQKPFAEVYSAVQELVHSHYSCFPLLVQMGALLMNHSSLAEPTEQPQILEWAKGLFWRVKEESGDIELSRMANYLEATCCLLSGQAAEAVDLLDGSQTPHLDPSTLLSAAYQMLDKAQKAREVLQTQVYQDILQLIQSLLALLLLEAENPARSEEVIRRLFALAESFNLGALHPVQMLSVYLSAAQVYAAGGKREETLEMLRAYADLVEKIAFPMVLHGDAFFTELDPLLSQLDLGIQAPVGNKLVKQRVVAGVTDNPGFAAWSEDPAFRLVKQRLLSILED